MHTDMFERLMSELAAVPSMPGLLMTDMLAFPDELNLFIQWLLRKRGAELSEMATFLSQTEEAIHPLMEMLIERGLVEHVQVDDSGYYRIRTRTQTSSQRRSPRPDLWKAVDDLEDE